jgi:type I restriction enzyme S subunit
LIDDIIGRKGKLIELLIQPVTDGPHTTPVLYKEGVPFVSATAVYDGKVHLNDMKGYISKEFDEECSRKYKPKKFDVYMVKSGSTTGKVAIVDFDADFNIWSPLAALRTASETQAWYLYHLLQTQNIQEQVFSRMSQGSQPNLSMRVIEQFDVVIPSLDDQERIVNILNKFDTYCNDLTQGLPAEIELRKQQYEYYRDKLLSFKELK